MMDYFEGLDEYFDDELSHYGTPRHSGRYPWGSGKDPYQSATDFLGTSQQLRKEGFSEKEISDYFGMTIKQYRARKSNARNEKWAADAAQVWKLKEKGYSNVAIGKKMGIGESQVRNFLKPHMAARANVTKNMADKLEESLKDQKFVDIGPGVENHLGVTRTALNNSISMLEDQGYKVYYIQTFHPTVNKNETIKVLASPDVTYAEVSKNRDKISAPGLFTENGVVRSIEPPVSIDSKRIKVAYKEDGGIDKDGVIELRRGVEDISLGRAHYAQVRIAVDGTHYLKGMAMYRDDMPPGVDIIFNTNKPKGTPLKGHKDNSVLKEMKSEPENPFGALIKNDNELILAQRHYTGKDGKTHQSALNIVNEEGNWGAWRKAISSQMLSKQSTSLAKKQLGLAYDLEKDKFRDIMELTNPTIRRALLEKFADGCDSAAVHLHAAALPRQASKVILPFPKMKDTEAYLPTLKNGERVALIRYPHGGVFEIPELTVNNTNKEAKKILGNAGDAIGISPRVAERLSGADFDGDTVLAIPLKSVKIKTAKPLAGLKDFDPKTAYPAYPGMKEVKTDKRFDKQKQMGKVSNLITDMTLKGASMSEIARAVRHSMVVIDAEKHNLNWEQSYKDNDIAGLKIKYQGGANRGASTLISKASSDARPGMRKEITAVSKMTEDEKKRYFQGEKVYRETPETYINKDGKTVTRTIRSTKMAETDDARTLSSGTAMENIYADHANKLKALANQARKEARMTKDIPYSPEAKKIYQEQVNALNSRLNTAQKNKPLERRAWLLANQKIRMVKEENPDMSRDDIKKLKNRALSEARLKVGAKKEPIVISPAEWKAIQAGAISTSKLKDIISNSDLDTLKKLAMPKESRLISPAKKNQVRALEARGYSLSEIAEAVGISSSSVNDILKD